ncbi:hypothetical protein GLAREA_11056 [Glarea lozoyensis ATCC 20868]|uniref:Chitin synthesis regulation, Congo red resistance, RCR protein n=1 Tax=Glarea lozoyensis (strain ATCC 20868 / MF5171) TaxID=1116229 RepID=S3DA87_GLAL2|nr:uncharacterized protein GLAREA_11056 [Glarea lozoyensis ATCC 20868]EPE35357.1 hypothetical protein GLAREA_11056 [Glarea lozoyensis ATCC 20868]
MAPLARAIVEKASELVSRELVKRRTCYRTRYGYTQAYRCSNSAWSRFGRWILAGVLILIGLILLLMILCLSRRRKRRAAKYATQPATTYNAPPQTTYNNTGYDQNAGYGNQQYAPPAGAPPPNYGGNEGYYNQGGVSQPGNTYQPQYK